MQRLHFYRYKSCFKSPHELKHPLHPKHPLTLTTEPFTVQPQCRSSLLIERSLEIKEAGIHPADSLTLVQKSISFNCDACGMEGKRMFYFCDTCSFMAHVDCYSTIDCQNCTPQPPSYPHLLSPIQLIQQ
ncbi:uncharacterized protein LOC122278579 [Carya illinoinensis]|uniref:uncharacterized protein LOC122278579 n=1 Tax=Carya illinoinensis TaxID=32201 RepID=UPI001C71D677|nr:uncharacterized protein LOC122278579 [Carya illinoinensis]